MMERTDGFFEFDQIQVVSVPNGRSVVRFSKAGYFDVVRSGHVNRAQTTPPEHLSAKSTDHDRKGRNNA